MSRRSVGRYIAVLVAVVLLVSAGVHFARVRHDIGSQRYDDMRKDGTATQYADLGGPDDRRLEPVDEASQNPGFIEFRDQLLAAAYEKDVDFLRKHTDDSIRYTFGVNRGISGFFEEWNLEGISMVCGSWYFLLLGIDLGILDIGCTLIHTVGDGFPHLYSSRASTIARMFSG